MFLQDTDTSEVPRLPLRLRHGDIPRCRIGDSGIRRTSGIRFGACRLALTDSKLINSFITESFDFALESTYVQPVQPVYPCTYTPDP
jgi:hypothetical protein